jgi:PLP dependent protein
MPFSDLPDRVREVRQRIDAARSRAGRGQAVCVIAVTKTHGPDAVEAAAAAGLEDVGENKVQEATWKMAATDAPVRWHLIGHLQRNKAKAATRFSMVHGVDSLRLADALAGAAVTPLDVLLQVNVAAEATKGGAPMEAVEPLAVHLATLPTLRLRGVMAMAPYTDDEGVLRRVFSGARGALALVQRAGHPHADQLSMGMSGDYEIAVEEGATMVRLGTVLFGART